MTMRIIGPASLAAALLLSPAVGGAQQHPSIFITKAEATQIRVSIGKYPLLDRSIQLVNSWGSDNSLNGRVLITFAGDMVNETRTWAEVRAHIQKLVAAAP